MCVDTVYIDNCSRNINKAIYINMILMNVVVDRLNRLIYNRLSYLYDSL